MKLPWIVWHHPLWFLGNFYISITRNLQDTTNCRLGQKRTWQFLNISCYFFSVKTLTFTLIYLMLYICYLYLCYICSKYQFELFILNFCHFCLTLYYIYVFDKLKYVFGWLLEKMPQDTNSKLKWKTHFDVQ